MAQADVSATDETKNQIYNCSSTDDSFGTKAMCDHKYLQLLDQGSIKVFYHDCGSRVGYIRNYGRSPRAALTLASHPDLISKKMGIMAFLVDNDIIFYIQHSYKYWFSIVKHLRDLLNHLNKEKTIIYFVVNYTDIDGRLKQFVQEEGHELLHIPSTAEFFKPLEILFTEWKSFTKINDIGNPEEVKVAVENFNYLFSKEKLDNNYRNVRKSKLFNTIENPEELSDMSSSSDENIGSSCVISDEDDNSDNEIQSTTNDDYVTLTSIPTNNTRKRKKQEEKRSPSVESLGTKMICDHKYLQLLDENIRVFYHDCGCRIGSICNYGRSFEGASVVVKYPLTRSKKIGIMSLLVNDVIVFYVQESYIHWYSFIKHLDDVISYLNNASNITFIMNDIDNNGRIRQAIEERGHELIYLPCHSVFFKPIQSVISQWKSFIKIKKFSNLEEVQIAIENFNVLFTKENLDSYYEKAKNNFQKFLNISPALSS